MLKETFRNWNAGLWAVKETARAARTEFWLLLTCELLLAFAPALTLWSIELSLSWIVGATNISWVWIGVLWGWVFTCEKASFPILSVLRIRLNEKALAHFNVRLMEACSHFEGLEPFERKSTREELLFLEAESSRRPMNFVYIYMGLLKGVVALAAMSLYLASTSWSLGLMLALASIPYALAVMWFEQLRWTETLFSGQHAVRTRWLASLHTSGPSIPEMRIFGAGKHLVERYVACAKSFLSAFSSKCWKEMAPAMACTSVTIFGFLGLLVWILHQGRSGAMEIATVAVALQGFTLMQAYVSGLLQDVAMAIPVLDYFRRFQKFENQARLSKAAQNGQHISSINHAIHFEDVSFCYPDGRCALDHLNLTIRCGETVALVGENGAGKSTLVKLLLRLYEPTSGRITVDGVDLRDIDLACWHSLCSAVFQEFGKYEFSIEDNIRLGVGGAQSSPIDSAIELSGLGPLIQKLPDGKDTLLGSSIGGTQLSGGEWHRVAITRALACPANLLVLDEPTASLDPRTEASLFETFAQAASGKTCILVTHRLGSVSVADRVIMISQGRVVEEGSHHDLMKRKGVYAEYYGIQAGYYALVSDSDC